MDPLQDLMESSDESVSSQTRLNDFEERLVKIDKEVRASSQEIERLRRLLRQVSNRLIIATQERELHRDHVRQFISALKDAAQQFLMLSDPPP